MVRIQKVNTIDQREKVVADIESITLRKEMYDSNSVFCVNASANTNENIKVGNPTKSLKKKIKIIQKVTGDKIDRDDFFQEMGIEKYIEKTIEGKAKPKEIYFYDGEIMREDIADFWLRDYTLDNWCRYIKRNGVILTRYNVYTNKVVHTEWGTYKGILAAYQDVSGKIIYTLPKMSDGQATEEEWEEMKNKFRVYKKIEEISLSTEMVNAKEINKKLQELVKLINTQKTITPNAVDAVIQKLKEATEVANKLENVAHVRMNNVDFLLTIDYKWRDIINTAIEGERKHLAPPIRVTFNFLEGIIKYYGEHPHTFNDNNACYGWVIANDISIAFMDQDWAKVVGLVDEFVNSYNYDDCAGTSRHPSKRLDRYLKECSMDKTKKELGEDLEPLIPYIKHLSDDVIEMFGFNNGVKIE